MAPLILIFCIFELFASTWHTRISQMLVRLFLGIYRNNKHTVKRPLKPIIITRDAIQKEIFGMGYKNVPVMSIEEFYEDRARKVDNIQDFELRVLKVS